MKTQHKDLEVTSENPYHNLDTFDKKRQTDIINDCIRMHSAELRSRKKPKVGRITISEIGSSQLSRLVNGESELLSEVEIEGEQAFCQEIIEKDIAYIESIIPRDFDIESDGIGSVFNL